MSFWDERYGEAELAYGAEPNDFLREVTHRIPPGPVLCLAEGQGRNAVWLAQQGYEVTALDASAVGLARARELASSRGVRIETVVADLADWEGPEAHWAGVVAIFAHLPPPVRERVHRSIVRWLRPGGVLVLEAYRPEQVALGTGGPPDPALTYTVQLLREELRELELVRLEAVDREVHEGRYHRGPSAVVQVLARWAGPAPISSRSP